MFLASCFNFEVTIKNIKNKKEREGRETAATQHKWPKIVPPNVL